MNKTESFSPQPEGHPKDAEKKPWSFPFRKKLLYFLVAAGAVGAASYPRETEDLLLATPGVQEMYEHESFDADEKEMAAGIKEQLGEAVGNFAIANIETGKSSNSEIESVALLGERLKPVEVSGFSEAGLSDDFIRGVLSTFPKGIQRQVKGVHYGESFLAHEENEVAAKLLYGRSAAPLATTNPNSQEVFIHSVPQSVGGTAGSANLLTGLIMHEAAGHAADWNSNDLLMRKEKMSLLLAILRRLEAPDHFKSKEFSGIEDGSSLHRYIRAMEYFAEISRVYLGSSTPEHGPNLPTADARIVQEFMDDMDPAQRFDAAAATLVRDEMIGNADNDRALLDTVERWKRELGK